MTITKTSSLENLNPTQAPATISNVSPEHIDLFSAGTPEEIQPSIEVIASVNAGRVQRVTEGTFETPNNVDQSIEGQKKKTGSKTTGADMF